MPSPRHEYLVDVCREAPQLVADLLRLHGVEVPPTSPARVVEAGLVDAVPVEWRADLVVTLGEPVTRVVLLEVQLRRDDAKHLSWPFYAAALQLRHRVPVDLVVLAPEPAVAAWARAPFPFGSLGLIRPLIVGATDLPPIAAPEVASANPHLAILAAVAHCRDPDHLPLLDLALEALKGLPGAPILTYTRYLGAALDARFRALPEVQMKFDPIEYYPQVKAYVEELRAEGRAQGLALGETAGRQQEALRLVLRMLGRRVGLPGAEAQARLEGLTTEQLEDLGEALLDFTQPEDLTAWLGALPKARKGRRKPG
ncbi:MAG: DUF4351 domain-containing protein [Candidatus Sericytochromatia bacterium]|nr:DUF4351 domain-containing protein [Candidatus Sericytochromatia bacterium]